MLSKLVLFTILFYQLQLSQQAYLPAKECSHTDLAKSVDNFGASLTKAIGGQDNLFISFFSIYNALAMTYIGANGKTAEEMETAFQLGDNGLDKPKLNKAFKDYLTTIKAGNDQYSLLVANGIFPQKDYAINDEFVSDVEYFYQGVVQKEDYGNDGQKAIEDINAFVSKNTRKMIEKLFEEPLDPNTVMVLVNAIYFKGIWKIQFPKEKTSDGLFFKSDGTSKSVKYMRLQKEKFRYYKDPNSQYQFLELPYKGEDVSMVLALPPKSEKEPDLELTSDFLCKINSSLENTTIANIAIPKFQLKYRKELKGFLQKLGIQDLFTNSADLTGMSQSGKMKVSAVLHEAIIDVNEEGSEAAAVTGVVVIDRLPIINFEINFVADRPFLFYIVDNRNGIVLFSGRVAEP